MFCATLSELNGIDLVWGQTSVYVRGCFRRGYFLPNLSHDFKATTTLNECGYSLQQMRPRIEVAHSRLNVFE